MYLQGKTTLLMKTLENAAEIYYPKPSRIIFMYNCKWIKRSEFEARFYSYILGFQDCYTQVQRSLSEQGIKSEFLKATKIVEDDLDEISDPDGGQTIIIVDDNSISAASSKEMAQIFTMARHKNCSIILLLHFIFGPWPSARLISANTAYFFLMNSPRLFPQVATLGTQLGIRKALVSAYQNETKKKFGYVLVDVCANTPHQLRIRSDILNDHQSVYIPKL
jgi:hypothetical protein